MRRDRCELALERGAVALRGRDLREQHVERGGLARGDRARDRAAGASRSRRRATSRRASRARRRAAATALRRRSRRARRARVARAAPAGRGCSISARAPLSVAAAGAACRGSSSSSNGCAGVSGSGTGASAVSRTTNRLDLHLRELARSSASSTGSTNAVRGSGIWPVASSIAFEPATYSSGRCEPRPSASMVGPAIGTYGSGRQLGRRARSAAVRTRWKPGASAGGSRASRRPGLPASRARCRASAGSCRRVRGASRCRSSRPPGLHRGERRRVDAARRARTGRLRAARSTRRAVAANARACCGSTTTIHVTNVLCVDLGADEADLDGIHARAVDADAARIATSRSGRTRRRSCALRRRAASDENGNVSRAAGAPAATCRSPRCRSRCGRSPSGGS